MSARIAAGEIVLGRLTAPAIRTARGVVEGRERLELVLFDEDGAFGIGEAAPLSGFSTERLEDARAALSAWLLRGPHIAPFDAAGSACTGAIEAMVSALPPIPSARFALETALLDLASRRAGVPAWSLFVREAATRPLSGLLTRDEPAALFEEAAALSARGFSTLKLKLGGRALSDDSARLEQVRRAAPTARLRLDVNGGGGHSLVAWVELIGAQHPELVEEPAPLDVLLEEIAARRTEGGEAFAPLDGPLEPSLARPAPWPIALDESLLSAAGLARALELAARGVVSAFVLKPAFLGGLLRARRIAAAAEARGVPSLVTHALDGPVGHAAASHLAWSLAPSPYADGLALHGGLAGLVDALPYLEGSNLVPPRAPGLVPEAIARDLLVRVQGQRKRRRDDPQLGLSIFAAAQAEPSRVALVDELGEPHTFAELAARVAAAQSVLFPARGASGERAADSSPSAASLAEGAAGFRSGDSPGVFALVGAPRLAEIVVALALLERRVPIVWLHPRAVEAERARLLEETGATLIDARAVLAGAPGRGGVALPRRLPWPTPAVVVFTSGSSGRPKAALLDRAALLAAAGTVLARLGVTEDDRFFLGMPLAHVGGLSVLLRGILARRPVVLARGERFDARAVAELFASEAITVASLVPTMLHRLLEEPTFERGALRAILLGGAAASPRLLAAARDRGLPVRTTYGLTETCAAATLADVGTLEGVGTALDGVELEVGAGGTIRVRGPTLMTGYLRAREGAGAVPEVDSARDADGWFDTGDFGEIDANGRVRISARRTDLIISGGENVYPAEVEAALETFPAIARACVFGIEDEAWGARVCAALVLAAPLDEAALSAHLRLTLAAHKRPGCVAELAGLPELASGKLNRRQVRTEATPRLRPLSPLAP